MRKEKKLESIQTEHRTISNELSSCESYANKNECRQNK